MMLISRKMRAVLNLIVVAPGMSDLKLSMLQIHPTNEKHAPINMSTAARQMCLCDAYISSVLFIVGQR
jgi:hypothetical protein